MEQTLSGGDAIAGPFHDSKSAFQKVTGKISEGISELAQRLDSESSKIGDARTGLLSAVAPEIKKYGHMTAEALERSADYVHNLDIDEIKDETKAAIKRNPGRALLIAAGAGLLLGALIKRRGI